MFWENLKMAFISIKNAKLRSFLTMLGIIIGVAAVISIVSIGQGVKASVQQSVAGLGSNVLSITSGQTNVGKRGGGNFAAALGSSTLTAQDVTTIQQTRHITHAAALSLISGVLSHGQTTASDAIIAATTPEYEAIRAQSMSSGRFLSTSDATRNVIVLGSDVATELFPTGNALGQIVNLRNTPLTVIGVIAKSDTGISFGASSDAIVYVPTGAAPGITGQQPSIMRIFAQVDTQTNVTSTVNALQASLKHNHGGQSDFTVSTQSDLLSAFDSILNLLTTFIVAIASISLLVGGIGIMNIMLVSVTERTREIGIRKALGATSMTVLGQFLMEAIVISLLGGALGVVVAIIQAKIAGHLAKITPVFTWQSIVLAVGISAGVGIIFGIAPAIKAARKHPIQALRYE